jgi:hypothetical protein
MQFDCGTCHKPHAATPGDALTSCAHCHVVAETAGLHARHVSQRCTACHPPHLWTAGKSGCLRCHAGADRHAESRKCAACHAFRSVGGRK